jgi:protein TonB
MYVFLAKHIIYPEEAIKQNASFGRTIVSFTVKIDGSLEKFKIITDPGFGMGEQLIRVLKTMPKWRPAKKSGKPVEWVYTLPLFIDAD